MNKDHHIETKNEHTNILGLHPIYSAQGILGLTLATPISAITVTFPREDTDSLNLCFRELMESPSAFKYGLYPERAALFLLQKYGYRMASFYEINLEQRSISVWFRGTRNYQTSILPTTGLNMLNPPLVGVVG
jgi:hypothetical protein